METVPEKGGTVITLIGWLRAEYLPELKARIESGGATVALKMADVTLVDVESVRFLGACESQGIELDQCPAYIREWIARERGRKL